MWNRRHVQQSSVGPAGKPNILLYLPTTVGYEHQGIPVDKNDITVATEIIGSPNDQFIEIKILLIC